MSILFLGFSTQASLSATTANVIQGTKPYFKISGDRVTDLNKLLDITVGSGESAKSYDVTYSEQTGIDFPINGGLGDVTAKVVTSNTPVLLSTLFAESTSRGDDDGDGGVNNDKYTVSGALKATWRGWKGNTPIVIADPKTSPSACVSDYDYFTLTVTTNPTGNDIKPKIATTFGYPLDAEYEHVSKEYKFNVLPGICAVKPGDLTVPGSPTKFPPMWDNTAKVFMPQSDYTKNFPTTAAKGLSFNLIVKGVDNAAILTWEASLESNSELIKIKTTAKGDENNVLIEFIDGPTAATQASMNEVKPFEFTISAKRNSDDTDILTQYKFKVQKWFINSGAVARSKSDQVTWCNSLANYQLASVADLTTANGKTGDLSGFIGVGTIPAVPYPNTNNNMFWRHIEGGLFSEWGDVSKYSGAGFVNSNNYWFFDVDSKSKPIVTRTFDGFVYGSSSVTFEYLAICVSK